MRTFAKNLSNENATITAYIHDKSSEMPNVDVRPAVLVFPSVDTCNVAKWFSISDTQILSLHHIKEPITPTP